MSLPDEDMIFTNRAGDNERKIIKLTEENARLREENEMFRSHFDDEKNQVELKEMEKLMNEIVKLKKIVRKQTEVLKNKQWSGWDSYYQESSCSECWGIEPRGHTPDCDYAKAIKAGEGI
jgi:hypothetical protein